MAEEMKKNNEGVMCFSCDFEISWGDILKAINSEEVLESENPALALAEKIEADKACCRNVIFNNRVYSALKKALLDKKIIDDLSQQLGPEHKFDAVTIFRDLSFYDE